MRGLGEGNLQLMVISSPGRMSFAAAMLTERVEGMNLV